MKFSGTQKCKKCGYKATSVNQMYCPYCGKELS